MTEPTPTPKEQNLPVSPAEETRQNAADENTSSPERDGFFKRVRRELRPAPTEAEEIIIMPGEEGEG